MVFGNGVKNIQIAAYNGARTVVDNQIMVGQTLSRKSVTPNPAHPANPSIIPLIHSNNKIYPLPLQKYTVRAPS